MNEIKYTTDGKKVVVIGDLNQTEKIVQEIFVTEDGCEIPSGERFVVKSLLDKPSISWKEKTLLELEAKFESESKKWKELLSKLDKEKRYAYDAAKSKLEYIKKFSTNNEFEKSIEKLFLFLNDDDKYIVVGWEIIKYTDEDISNFVGRRDCYASFENLRLISIFGKSNGDITYKINAYSDGSGYDSEFDIFKNYDDAVEFLRNKFYNLKKYEDSHIDVAKKYGFKLDNEKFISYKENKIAYNNSQIELLSKKIKEYKEFNDNIFSL